MNSEDQPTILSAPPNGSRPASVGWQAPSVEEMQAMLPQYEVLDILGRGGMGAVYKARQKSLKRLVAIKILPLGMADDEMKFVERFQNEAQTMAAMNHPAIVSVYDFGETANGLLYFIMEYVDGSDVHKLIQASGELSGEYALAITAHVCDALDYAHKRGVIHRDIKPANILIDQEGHIKVADFGLAKMDDPSQTSGLTKTNMAMGTPDYVAPEVLSPGMVADHRADLYAVGVMLYQMLTGEVPRGMFKLPSQKGIGSDPRFDEIICKAMEQDREERYQSAMDVRRDLDVILTTPQPKDDGTGIVQVKDVPEKPVAKRPLPSGERGKAAAQGKAVEQPASAMAKAPPQKPSPVAMWLSIGGIVTVLCVAGFLVLGGKSKPGTETATSASNLSQADKQPQSGSTEAQPSISGTAGKDVAGPSKLSASFFSEVAKSSGPRQVELVGEKIKELNGVPVILVPTIEKGKVLKLVVNRAVETKVPDLSPIAALAELQTLTIDTPGAGDLSWLRGTKINTFTASNDSFPDIKPLAEQPLAHLTLKSGPERDYSVLAGLKLRTFVVYGSPVRDISFLKGMPLSNLGLEKTGFSDWSAVRDLPLSECGGDLDPERDGPVLRSIPTLKKINGKPAAEFWADAGGKAVAPAGKTIDLLPLVDVKRDTITGEWSRDGGDLLVKDTKIDAKGTPRLQLPYQPPEEYDFEIEFTPEAGTNSVYQLLSAYQRSFAWVMDVNLTAGNKAGFDRIDGQFLSGRTNGTTMKPKFLTNGQRHRSTVEVRKTGVRGFLDGDLLVSFGSSANAYQAFDSSPNEAMRDTLHLGLAVRERAVRFHKLAVREISGTGKVDAAAAQTAPGTAGQAQAGASVPSGPVIDWINGLPPEAPPWSAKWGGLKDGVLTPTTKCGRLFGLMKDGSVRVRIRLAPDYPITDAFGPMLQLDIRHGSVKDASDTSGQFQFQVFVPNRDCKLLYQQKVGKGPNSAPLNLWEGSPRKLKETGHAEVDWEFRAVGDEFSAWADGKLIHTARLDKVASGYCTLSLLPGMQITRLETTGLIPTTPGPAKDRVETGQETSSANASLKSTNPLPVVLSWKDVTDQVRAKARGNPDLIVDPDAVRLKPVGRAVAMPLDQGPAKGVAVRLTHAGDGQVSWRAAQGGVIYVLCQRTKTIFQRHPKDAPAPTPLQPDVSHSDNFVHSDPHELVMVLDGSRLAAWVDGRFIGEVRDETFAGSLPEIYITKWGDVRKVEIAELDGTTAKGDWHPIFMKREDFGGDLRDVEFRDGATLLKSRSHLAPSQPSITAIRSTMRYLQGDRTGSLTIRSTESAPYGEEDFGLTAFIAPKGDGLVVKMRDRSASINALGRHDFPLSSALKEGELFTSELKIEGKKIIASINGREVGSLNDAWMGGTRRFGITPSNTEMTEFRDVAVRRSSTAAWTDWLGPKLAAGDFATNGWVRSSKGVTTEREISGLRVLPPGTKNAAVRVTYVLQDSEGLMLNARERMEGKVRLAYCAIDKVTRLHLDRLKPDGRNAALQHVILPEEADRMAERILELRIIGNQIKAMLNGTFAGTATDDTLTEGEWTLVFMKGVLVKKVEVQPLDAAP